MDNQEERGSGASTQRQLALLHRILSGWREHAHTARLAFQEEVQGTGLRMFYAKRQSVRLWLRTVKKKQALKDVDMRVRRLGSNNRKRLATAGASRVARRCHSAQQFHTISRLLTKKTAFLCWNKVVHRHTALHNGLSHLRAFALHVAFRRLLLNVACAMEQSASCAILASVLSRAMLSSAWKRWVSACEEHERSQILGALENAFAGTRKLRFPLHRWRRITLWRRRFSEIHQQSLTSARNRRLTRILTGWKAVSNDSRKEKVNEFLAFVHWSSKQLRHVFDALKASWITRRARRAHLKEVGCAVQRWQRWASLRVHSRARYGRIEELTVAKSIRRTFHAWILYHRRQQQTRYVTILAQTFRRLALMQGAFTFWGRVVNATRGRRKRVEFALAQRRRTQMRWVFRAWKAYSAAFKTRQTQVATLHAAHQVRALREWKSYAHHHKILRGLQAAVTISSLRSRCLSNVRWWRQCVEHASGIQLAQGQLADIVRSKRLRAGMSTWKLAAGSSLVQKRFAVKAAALYRTASLKHTFQAWASYAAMDVKLQHAQGTCAMKRKNYIKSRVMGGWRAALNSVTLTRQRALQFQRSLFDVLIQKRLQWALSSWEEAVLRDRLKELVICNLHSRHQRRQLMIAFEGLRFNAAKRKWQHSLSKAAEKLNVSLFRRRYIRNWYREHLEFRRELASSSTAYAFRAQRLYKTAVEAWKSWLIRTKRLAAAFRSLNFGAIETTTRWAEATSAPQIPTSCPSSELDSLLKAVVVQECLVHKAAAVCTSDLDPEPQFPVSHAAVPVPTAEEKSSRPASRPRPRQLDDHAQQTGSGTALEPPIATETQPTLVVPPGHPHGNTSAPTVGSIIPEVLPVAHVPPSSVYAQQQMHNTSARSVAERDDDEAMHDLVEYWKQKMEEAQSRKKLLQLLAYRLERLQSNGVVSYPGCPESPLTRLVKSLSAQIDQLVQEQRHWSQRWLRVRDKVLTYERHLSMVQRGQMNEVGW